MEQPSPRTPGVSVDPLTRRLAQWLSLSPEEMAVLGDFQASKRTIARRRDIISEGRKYDALAVLIEGTAIRYRVLHDGRRQVLNIVLPGDFIGFPGCFFESALYSITALSEAIVSFVPFERLFRLFETHPRLAAIIFWSFSCEAAMSAEHLIDVGRRSALERVAHLLLELLTRLQAIGQADELSYDLPLTQELIGDALSLSLPRVNHALRQLRESGLVGVERRRVTIKDREELSALADFKGTYLANIAWPNWRPTARWPRPL
jgi:CRP-like cAMP-binding protein